jgi:RsiW-degrading membrane proteinase PrsW (M82 family)
VTAPSVGTRTGPDDRRAHARAQTLAIAAWIAYILLAMACIWVLLAELRNVVSVRAFASGVLFAALPAPVLVVALTVFDRRRPPPLQQTAAALVWGSCIATLIALKVNEHAVGHIDSDLNQGLRGAIFVAPWVEEAAKALVVFGIAWWQRRRLVTPLGAAVYGAIAGVGFAFTENVVYYSGVFQSTVTANGDRGLALDAVRDLFWWRGVAAPFVHPVFTLVTGLGIGLALRQRHVGARILAPVAGYLGAVLLHTGYNTLAAYATDRQLSAIYVGILLPLLLGAIVALVLVRRHDRRVIAARLDDYVATGWLRPWQADAIATASGRREVLRRARPYGLPGRRLARAWLASGIELGAVRDRVVRGVASDGDLRAERALLDVVRGVLPQHRDPQSVLTQSADVVTQPIVR